MFIARVVGPNINGPSEFPLHPALKPSGEQTLLAPSSTAL
jgi:hypothetical protein